MDTAHRTLLEPDEPDPVVVLNPSGASDFFLTADHAGRAIPRRLGRLGVPESELLRHIAWDIGIAGVTRRLSAALDATAVLQHYSRLVIDCNREPNWPTAMPDISEHTPIPGNIALSAEDRTARVAAVFTPYHDRIRAFLDARAAAGRRTVLVAMHSFTPVFKGASRAMQVGVLYNRDARLAGALLEVLRAEGDLTVANLRNWLDCVKSRVLPNADVEIGHRSTTFSHLGNIALATRSVIEWDAKAERITNNEQANSLLQYEYRAPWTLG